MKNDINFALSYKSVGQRVLDEYVRKLIIISAVCAFLVLSVFTVLKIMNIKMEMEIKKIEQIVNSNNYKKDMETLAEEVKKARKYESDSKKTKEIIDSFSVFNRTLMNNILAYKPGDVVLNQVIFENNELRLVCKTNNADSPSAFARSISASGLFLKVDYTGFEYNDREGEYSFDIKCVLKGGAAK